MATTKWNQISPLERLYSNPELYDFFQTVRLLENQGKEIHYHSIHKSNFAVSPIHAIQFDGIKDCHIYVSFMGLMGPQGVLPSYLQELITEDEREGRHALKDFFDIFNHKLLSLLYKTWCKNNLITLSESNTVNFYSRILKSIAGMGTPFLKSNDLPDETIYNYSSLFSHKIHSGKTLQSMLSEYFNLSITIQELEPKWIYLSSVEQSEISTKGDDLFNQVGRNLILGKRYLSVQSHFRIIINTYNYSQYRELIPNGRLIKSIIEMTRLFVRYELSFDIKVILSSNEIPFCKLSSHSAARLSWNSWLLSRSSFENLSSVITVH